VPEVGRPHLEPLAAEMGFGDVPSSAAAAASSDAGSAPHSTPLDSRLAA
jgi:hypothetical protein